jgi:hypothetical protein
LSALNQKMAAAGVYGSGLQKRIDEWASMRERAEAGELSPHNSSEAEILLKGVREFVNDHLF